MEIFYIKIIILLLFYTCKISLIIGEFFWVFGCNRNWSEILLCLIFLICLDFFSWRWNLVFFFIIIEEDLV